MGAFRNRARFLVGVGVRQIGGPSRLSPRPIISDRIARLGSKERDQQIKGVSTLVPFFRLKNVFVFEGTRHVIIMEDRNNPHDEALG